MAQLLSPGAIPDPEPAPAGPEEWEENLSIRLMCPECREDPPELFEDHQSGDTICASCGIVLGQRGIDTRAEWRTFANDDQGNDDPSRVGDAPNPLLSGNQLQTSIAFGDGSMRSKELHRAQNKSTLDKTNKTLLAAFKQIGAYCDAYSLPQIVSDGAKHIYKDAYESSLFKNKNADALMAGCLFIACRRNNFPRTFHEMYELTKVSKKDIGRVFKLLEKFLVNQDKQKGSKPHVIGNGIIGSNEDYKASQTTSPSELCNRFCSILGLDVKTSNLAVDIASRMSNEGALAGRSPLSAAAACIYMASHLAGHGRTPKEISEAAKVSDSTIRSAYKGLYSERETVISPEWLAKGYKMENLPKPS